MESWLNKRDLAGVDPSGLEKSCLPGLFDKYIDATNDSVRKGFKEVHILVFHSSTLTTQRLLNCSSFALTVYTDVSAE